jgi:hypothetical protein
MLPLSLALLMDAEATQEVLEVYLVLVEVQMVDEALCYSWSVLAAAQCGQASVAEAPLACHALMLCSSASHMLVAYHRYIRQAVQTPSHAEHKTLSL